MFVFLYWIVFLIKCLYWGILDVVKSSDGFVVVLVGLYLEMVKKKNYIGWVILSK